MYKISLVEIVYMNFTLTSLVIALEKYLKKTGACATADAVGCGK